MRLASCLLLTTLCLGACATSVTYDPEAKESIVRVVEKSERMVPTQSVGPPLFIPVMGFRGGAIVPLIIPGKVIESQMLLYDYTLERMNGERIKRTEMFGGYRVGQCITYFESSQPRYPRTGIEQTCP